MDEFLDSLPPPAIVVQHTRRVLAANSAAKALMSKEHCEMTGQLGGYALGCIYADGPDTCGQAVHCKSCAIKNSVMHTMTTGKPLTDIPASPELSGISGKRLVHFLISTEKVGDFVVVTLRDLGEDEKVTLAAETSTANAGCRAAASPHA